MKEMIHKYVQNGQYIVLDVCSGGVHVVDELTYKLLDYVAPPFADVCPDEIIAKMDGFDKDDVRSATQSLKSFMTQRCSLPRTITSSTPQWL